MIKLDTIPTSGLREYIEALAQEHGVIYVPGPYDELAAKFSELSDKGVAQDDTERLLIALKRAGVISCREMIDLLGAYLHETMPPSSDADNDSGYRVGPHVDDWTPPESHEIFRRMWEEHGLVPREGKK